MTFNMKARVFLALMGCLASSLASPVSAGAGTPPPQRTVGYGRLPLQFEVNRGQAPRDVRFLSRGKGYSLFLMPTEAVLAVHQDAAPAAGGSIVRMKLLGANAHSRMIGTNPLPGRVNYLIGRDPGAWLRKVPTFARAAYDAAYPGIDLVYYGNQGQLEYDFIVAPGADPARIHIAFDGVRNMRLNGSGELVLDTGSRSPEMRWRRPVAYQNIGGKRLPVTSRYVLRANRTLTFALGRYDRTRPLIIDPTLVYSTFLGGTGGDAASGIAVDASGCAYVTGSTTSSDFPVSANAFQKTHKGVNTTNAFTHDRLTVPNVFVSKLSADGRTLLYSTYLGGTGGPGQYGSYGGDAAGAIAVDGAGSAYITGSTYSGDFPVTPGAYRQTGNAYYTDPNTGQVYWKLCSFGFLTKLNADGSDLAYSTYFGAESVNGTHGAALVVDASGSAFVTGFTQSGAYPTTPGAPFPTYQAGSSPGSGGTGFLTRFNAAGSGILYSTFVPGPCAALAVDPVGNAYVAGDTWKPDYPTTANAYQQTLNQPGRGDVFLLVLNSAGTGIVYSTLLGGTQPDLFGDRVTGIALDSSGHVYLAGYTIARDFPTTPGALMPVPPTEPGGSSYWLAKLDPDAATGPESLLFSTYIGPHPGEYFGTAGAKIALAGDGSILLSGVTTTTTPGSPDHLTLVTVTPDALQPVFGGGDPNRFTRYPMDVFLMKINPTATRILYASYFGGEGDDFVNAMAQGPDGDLYLAGYTKSSGFPIQPADVYQPLFHGVAGSDITGRPNAFVARFSLPAGPPARVKSEMPAVTGGLPPPGGIYGPGDGITPGQVTRRITGRGHPGCLIQVTVSDPLHPNSGDNFALAPITVNSDGAWFLDLTLYDCDPEVLIVQICPDEDPSDPVTWTGPVDGTPPHFLTDPPDGDQYVGPGGTGGLHLIGVPTDGRSFAPGPIQENWTVRGPGGALVGSGNGPDLTLPLPPGDYDVEVTLIDLAGNKLTKHCHRRIRKRPTALTCPEFSGAYSDIIALSGTLTDITPDGSGNGVALSGKMLAFTIKGLPAANPYTILLPPGEYPLTVSFAGDSVYEASASSCHLTVNATPGKITGGGSIDEKARNFGFVVTSSDGKAFKGSSEFQDKVNNINLHATAITSLSIGQDRIHGLFAGTATLNGTAGYTFTVRVEDNGEPGAGVDRYRIEIQGPDGFSYDSGAYATKGGLLDKGGNIQIHKEP